MIDVRKALGTPESDSQRLSEGLSKEDFSGRVERNFWFHTVDGIPVGFVNILHSPDDKFFHVLEVEVREGFRGFQLGVRMIMALEEKISSTARSNGEYTVSGFRSIAPYFHSEMVLDMYEDDDFHMEQSFVADWDNRVPLCPPR